MQKLKCYKMKRNNFNHNFAIPEWRKIIRFVFRGMQNNSKKLPKLQIKKYFCMAVYN